jgi:hypothetical protein
VLVVRGIRCPTWETRVTKPLTNSSRKKARRKGKEKKD